MGLFVSGNVSATCDECGSTAAISFGNVPFFSGIDKLGSSIGAKGWVVLGGNGEMMCGVCNGMSIEDCQQSSFGMRSTGKDWR